MRNPFTHIVSSYFYRGIDRPGGLHNELSSKYHYRYKRNFNNILISINPELGLDETKRYTFEENVRYLDYVSAKSMFYDIDLTIDKPDVVSQAIDRHNLGELSYLLIQLLAPDPTAIFELEPTAFKRYFLNREFEDWRKDIHVLHTENLSIELYRFLLSQGYPETSIKHILHGEKINVSKFDPAITLWTPELRQFYYDRTWVAFELFPEYKPELDRHGIKVKTLGANE